MKKVLRLTLAAAGLLGLLTPLWSCSAMNIDQGGPVKAQNADSLRQLVNRHLHCG